MILVNEASGRGESAIFKEVIPRVRMQVKIRTDQIRHMMQPEET